MVFLFDMSKYERFKYQLGVVCIILSFVSPLFVFVIPFLNFPAEWNVTLGTAFLVGLPEIFFILGAILFGKKAAIALTQKIKSWFWPR